MGPRGAPCESRPFTKALSCVIPGLAEGESPEPINTCGADSRTTIRQYRKVSCLWVPGSGLRPAPE